MVDARKKTAKRLEFEITAPLAMGLSKGDTELKESNDAAFWLRFSVCPARYPSQQTIYLVPKEAETDDTTRTKYDFQKRRRLTHEVEGSLHFNMRSLADQEASEESKPDIGELSHGPEYSDREYGHAEFYYIEINLPEDEFRQIRDIFLSGKSPTSIAIWTPDVEYDVGPDGSDKVWPVWDAHSTFATIVGFSLALSTDIPRVEIGLKKTENDAEETTKHKAAILHSREDIQLLCFGQAAMNAAIIGLRKQISILIGVVIVFAVVASLHWWR